MAEKIDRVKEKDMNYFKKLLQEFRDGSAATQLNIIANILSIIGVSFILLLSKVVVEKLFNTVFKIGESLFGVAYILVYLTIFVFILSYLQKTKHFFVIHMLAPIYWFINLFIICFALGLFFTFGTLIFRDIILW